MLGESRRRDVDSALEQFSEDVFFQDMMFPEPIRGKAELREHFDRSCQHVPSPPSACTSVKTYTHVCAC